MHDPTSDRPPEGPAALFAAIRARDVEAVRAIADRQPETLLAFDPDNFEAPPLSLAVCQGDPVLVEALLDRGADPNRPSCWWAGGFRPLHLALDRGDAAMAALLMERGAEVDAHAAAALGEVDRLAAILHATPWAVHQRAGDGQTPLHYAASPAIADCLLQAGARIDARDIDHFGTPAQWSVAKRPAVAGFLVDRGAETDAFMLAALGRVEALRQRLDTDPEAAHRRITEASFPSPGSDGGHIYLYVFGCGLTPLAAALRGEQLAAARLLAERGSDLRQRGGYDDATLLHSAAWDNRVRAAEWLLDQGADLEARSGSIHNNTPFGWAIVGGSVEAVELLLQRGATIEDGHRRSVEAGLRGEFSCYSGKPLENYEAIAALLNG